MDDCNASEYYDDEYDDNHDHCHDYIIHITYDTNIYLIFFVADKGGNWSS